MNTMITGRKMEITQSLKEHIEKKMKRIKRYSNNIQDASVILSVEKTRQIAEIKMNISGNTLWGREANQDMYAAVDAVTDKVIRQLKKTRDKLKKRKKSSVREFEEMELMEVPVESQPKKKGTGKIIPSRRYTGKPIFPDDAVIEMESQRRSFIVFLNAENGKVNVLYAREDGNYGLIQPENG